MKITYLMVILLFGLSACSGESDENDDLFSKEKKVEVSVNREVFDEMIQTLPQPIEIASIISSSESDFSKEMLIPSDNAGAYPDKNSQAMAMGAFAVDLGYINMQQKTLYVLEYLESIKTLSEELSVDQFFDFATLADMSMNANNVDSLIHISTKNFRKIDEFMREKNRGELSVLMMIGAWMEGMNMFVELEEGSGSEDMKNRIGEQKVVYENIAIIMDKMNGNAFFAEVQQDMKPLDEAYDKVKIFYEYKEPVAKEVDGELVFEDQTETMVNIDDETLDQIRKGIKSLRDKYFIVQ